jgi:hypothetical protein
MAQMNKKTSGNKSLKEGLEKELMGDILSAKQNVDGGRDVEGGNRSSKARLRSNRMFAISQGYRRRHPASVLQQYSVVVGSTDSGQSSWEEAMVHENERVEMDPVYTDLNESQQVVTQVGLVQTALRNFRKSKQKLSSLHANGV